MTTVAPDFGLDLACVEDLDPAGREVSGFVMMIQWAFRVLDTQPGSLVDDEDGVFGFGLRDLISKGITQDDIDGIPGRLAAAYEQDERIVKGSVKARVTFKDGLMRCEIRMSTGAGPFSLVVNASQADVAFVRSEAT